MQSKKISNVTVCRMKKKAKCKQFSYIVIGCFHLHSGCIDYLYIIAKRMKGIQHVSVLLYILDCKMDNLTSYPIANQVNFVLY